MPYCLSSDCIWLIIFSLSGVASLFLPTIRTFFGVSYISINSMTRVLYPQYSSTRARIASVTIAA